MFFRENQCVVQWAIDRSCLCQPDPPVLVSDPYNSTIWHVDAPTLSEFALVMLAMSAKFSSAALYHANGGITDAGIELVEEHVFHLPFSDPHWPEYPSRLYGNDLARKFHA